LFIFVYIQQNCWDSDLSGSVYTHRSR